MKAMITTKIITVTTTTIIMEMVIITVLHRVEDW
jgi:hypothetical protein